MPVFYAKSPENGFQETVRRHVQKVSRLAGEFAAEFGCSTEGTLIGLAHDFGKYSRLFQDVLDGRAHRINHAAPGALLVQDYCKQRLRAPRDASEALAMAVFAHHSRLESQIDTLLDGSRQNNPYFDAEEKQFSVAGKSGYAAAVQQFLAENGSLLPAARLQNPASGLCNNPSLGYMLYVRMLFSCLVDADYCVSAQEDRLDAPPSTQTPPLQSDAILQKIEEYREGLRSHASGDPKINQIREKLYQDCLQAAEKPPGLFTLTAPTGTGKTLALLAFALRHAQQYGKKRVFIVLPFLSIIQQNAAIYRKLAGEVLEDHSQSRLDEDHRRLAERWGAPLTITTSVKFFESLFASLPTDCRKLHHLADSVVVFDEAQSLPPHLVGATLDTVNALCSRYGCSVVFSTATQPAFDFRSDIVWKPTEIVHDSAQLFDQTRRVEAEWRLALPTPLDEIAEEMAGQPQCCAIVNLRRHTRSLFAALRARCPNPDELFFLTTDLCSAHREAILEKIHERLDQGLPCRLVATQCVEAGVDFSFPVLYRALAPLEAIIQAAGRCNRSGELRRNGKPCLGRLIVFIPADNAKKGLYPSDYYAFAASCVQTLHSRHLIDLNSPAQIREYYELLYADGGKDDPKLLDAISALNFQGVDETYRLIKQEGYNVVVPYNAALFNSICEEARRTGLTPDLMMRARPITVNSGDRRLVADTCEPLLFHHKGELLPSGWFLLGNPGDYDEKTGLLLAADADTFI